MQSKLALAKSSSLSFLLAIFVFYSVIVCLFVYLFVMLSELKEKDQKMPREKKADSILKELPETEHNTFIEHLI